MCRDNRSHGLDARVVLDIPEQGSGSIRRCTGPIKRPKGVRCKNPSPAARRDEADIILKRTSLTDPSNLRDDSEELTKLARTTLCYHHTVQVGEVVKRFREALDKCIRKDNEKRRTASPMDPWKIEGKVGTHDETPSSSKGRHSVLRRQKQLVKAQQVCYEVEGTMAEDEDEGSSLTPATTSNHHFRQRARNTSGSTSSRSPMHTLEDEEKRRLLSPAAFHWDSRPRQRSGLSS